MNKTTRTILIIISSLALVAIVACGAAGWGLQAAAKGIWNQVTALGENGSIAAQIADFDLPSGYQSQFALEIQDYQLAAYAPVQGIGHIYLFQAPGSLDIDTNQLQEKYYQYNPDANSRNVHLVETRPITLRGQQVTLAVSEGTNSDQMPYRELMAIFQGKGGPALVSISAPLDNWDEASFGAFLASIR